MVILDPKGMTFDAVGAFGLAFQFLFKSGSYCAFSEHLNFPIWNLLRYKEKLLSWAVNFGWRLLIKVAHRMCSRILKLRILHCLFDIGFFCDKNLLFQERIHSYTGIFNPF